MADSTQIARQWLLLRTLSSRRAGCTLHELARDFDVSTKTIRRDLDALTAVGFALHETAGPHGEKSWRIETDSILAGLTLTFDEVAALYLGRRFLEPLAGTMIWQSAHSALRKIRAALDTPALDYLEQLTRLIHRTSFRDSRYHDKSQILDDLMVGIEDRRITFITYQSARSTEPLTYDVYPYGLVYHRGSLYLVARSQQHDEVRTFKVDRITDVKLETLTFQRPKDFNLADHLAGTFGVFHTDGPAQTVRIRFAPEVAGYLQEHHWHPTQQLTTHPDGTLTAEFQLTDLHEVKAWVLSFGAKAVVEEPEELRDQIRHELIDLLDAYAHPVQVGTHQSL